jgi:cytochrome c553
MRKFGQGLWALAVVAAGLAGANAARAQEGAVVGNAERGARLGYTCLGCHAIPNYKNVAPVYRVPKLAGQTPEYIVIALQGYKSQERGHATMHAQAASMSDQDMADIAVYLSGTAVKSNPAAKPVGQAPEQVASICASCHGTDGVGITPQYPTLAGQHADYIERALHDYKRGGRKNPIMAGFVGTLTDADIKALAAYYGSQPGLSTVKKRATRLSAR